MTRIGLSLPSMGAFDQAKEEIRSRADIVSVVGRRVSLKRKGAHWAGRCPFHDDHDPSMHVNPVLGIYKCFVCGAGGDVFKFVMEHDHIGFRETMEQLAKETGVQLPDRAAQDPQEASQAAAARAALDWAQGFYHRALLAAPEVLAYARKRGLTDEEIGDFRIGFAPDGDRLLTEAPLAGHSLESLEAAGLVARTESGRVRDRFYLRLIFPLCDLSRRVVGFAGRNLRSGQSGIPKYLNSPETDFYRKSNFLFGFGHARAEIGRSTEAVVVEGYMDWHALWRHGIKNVVAASGTAFTREQAKLLARHAKKVVCFFDGDRAGLAAAERSLPILLAENLEVRIANLEGTGAKDPDELLKSSGPEMLRDRIAESTHWLGFLLDGLWRLDPRPSPDRRADMERRIEALLGAISDPALRGQCLEMADSYLERWGVRQEHLQARMTGLPPERHRTDSTPLMQKSAKREILTGIRRVEAQFVHTVLSHPVLVLDAREHVHPSDLSEPRCRMIWDLLVAQTESDGVPPNPRTFVAGLDSTLADFAGNLFQFFEVRPDELDARKWLDDFLRDFQVRRARERRRHLASEARICGPTSESPLSEYSELLAREQNLLSSTRMDS